MDPNKLKVLKEIGYEVRPGCGLCKNGNFRGGDYWGTCLIYTYDHEKHSGPPRALSIHKFGACPSFMPKEGVNASIHGFVELATWNEEVKSDEGKP